MKLNFATNELAIRNNIKNNDLILIFFSISSEKTKKLLAININCGFDVGTNEINAGEEINNKVNKLFFSLFFFEKDRIKKVIANRAKKLLIDDNCSDPKNKEKVLNNSPELAFVDVFQVSSVVNF